MTNVLIYSNTIVFIMIPPHIFMLNERLYSHLFCLPLIGLLFIQPNTLSVTIIKTTDVA